MLNILLMIIFIIILILIIILYIGITINVNYTKAGSSIEGCLKILILKKIKVYSLEYPPSDSNSNNEKRDTEGLIDLIKPCGKDLILFLKETIKTVRVKKLENHLIFGARSYADTGKYIGIIWAILSIVNTAHKNARLTAEPSFKGEVFDSKGIADLNINVLKVMIPALKLLSKKPVRNLIKGVLNG